jgi:predicted NBD/HSP70 family sugar kinase
VNVLVVDVGGTGVKVWKGAESERLRLSADSGSTPDSIMKEVRKHLDNWQYDCVSIGLPAEIVNGRPAAEPLGLGKGWVQFDYPHAFEKPVRMMNDAAMQALGSYDNGRML